MSKGPVDVEEREAAVTERARNVLIDAGAGTGKTTTLVARIIEMVAAEEAPVPMSRIAAVTFTRCAAGEMRFRLREELSAAQAGATSSSRARLLRVALSELDTAWVGTIHSFADRLLRLKPVEARLSPAYEIADDTDALIAETYERLLRCAESGTLRAEIAGSPAADRAQEAEAILLEALASGLPAAKRETEFCTYHGLDSLVAAFVLGRDTPPPDRDAPALSIHEVRMFMEEFTQLTEPLSRESSFARWLHEMAGRMRRLRDETDPTVLYRELVGRLTKRAKGKTRKSVECAGDDLVWDAWKALIGDERKKNPVREESLAEDITRPLRRWLGCRLVRIFPVVIELYERVKARHRAVDHIDLLLQLRDLLRDDREARAYYQGLFDHILVDEFQDTDPLQAEILLYLSEETPAATTWSEVVAKPGRLTIVGDPKQSIYRFRRADIAMYDQVRRQLSAGALEVRLEANFRSTPTLIDWLNRALEPVLGQGDEDALFDSTSGQVFHRNLAKGRGHDAAIAVHALPYAVAAGEPNKADDYRGVEAEMLPRYLRWLVGESGFEIVDPVDATSRSVRYGDIAILTIATTHIPMLSRALNAFDVPHAVSGGRTFLADPLHKQFLLGLRALADPDDGIAEAALLRSPFFALDLDDHAAACAGLTDHDGVQRLAAAREQIRDLRRRRFQRSVAATAHDLLEATAFGRAVALGPNGLQRLARLRELCHLLERMAVDDGLDYDSATARTREWVTDPIQLDPPRPVDANAVQILTVHQAKGLEWPVVVLWDGRAGIKGVTNKPPWRRARVGGGWSIALEGLEHSEPRLPDLGVLEKEYLAHERNRIVYVAATRARDLVVIPSASTPKPSLFINDRLLNADYDPGVERLAPYVAAQGAMWSTNIECPRFGPPAQAPELEQQVNTRWREALAKASQPRWKPIGVSTAAHATHSDASEEGALRKTHEGRFGPTFGTVVHEAIALTFHNEALSPAQAVAIAAREHQLEVHLDDATTDVARTRAALEAEGLRDTGVKLRLEYPVISKGPEGEMLLGYVDLVAVRDGKLIIIDFKSDQPPKSGSAAEFPQYVKQVKLYGALLSEALGMRETAGALLFTATGQVCWCEGD